MPNSNKLPLHDFHKANGARFVPFGGWEMPVQYSSILEEHKAVREAAGLFDVSHMGEVLIHGPEAAAYLDHLLVNAIASAEIGRAIYSPMCLENGGVVDDLIVYRMGAAEFLLCVNAANHAKDLSWMQTQADASGMDVCLEDQSDAYALLALQGPKAADILEVCGFAGIAELKRFRHESRTLAGGATVRICRTGYTGEDGFELFLPVGAADSLASMLLDRGTSYGLRLCGLGARDSLRLEAGLPLYGHELTETISPLEAGLEWTVKLGKSGFVGKSALLKQKEDGLDKRVVHFKLAGRRIAREGAEVIDAAGTTVGSVLSGTHSPILNCPIGSALIEVPALAGGLSVDLRGQREPLELASPPLHLAE